MYDLAVVSMFKNESMILGEWLAHHVGVGVQHFYLIDNGSTDDYLPVLTPYIHRGMLTLVVDPFRAVQGTSYTIPRFSLDSSRMVEWSETPRRGNRQLLGGTQTILFNKHFLEIIKRKTKWVLVVDQDEYIFSMRGSITDVLHSADSKCTELFVPWRMFGSGGHERQPSSIREGFTKMRPFPAQRAIATEHTDIRGHGKYISRVSAVEALCIHGCHIPTRVTLTPDNILILSDIGLKEWFNTYNVDAERDLLLCNHYAVMSNEYFVKSKSRRGGGAYGAQRNDGGTDYFSKNNAGCSTEDKLVLLRKLADIKTGVVVAAYNCDTVMARQCLDCFARHVPDAFIVMQLGISSDPDVLNMMGDYPSVRYVYASDPNGNSGLADKWNAGIDLCVKQNCNVVVLSSNDVIFDGSVEHIIREAGECVHTGSMRYFGPVSNDPVIGALRTPSPGQTTGQRALSGREQPPHESTIPLSDFFIVFPVHVLVENRIAGAHGPRYFKPVALSGGSDDDWHHRFMAKGGAGVVVPRTFVYHYMLRTRSAVQSARRDACVYTIDDGRGSAEWIFHDNGSYHSRSDEWDLVCIASDRSMKPGSTSDRCVRAGIVPVWGHHLDRATDATAETESRQYLPSQYTITHYAASYGGYKECACRISVARLEAEKEIAGDTTSPGTAEQSLSDARRALSAARHDTAQHDRDSLRDNLKDWGTQIAELNRMERDKPEREKRDREALEKRKREREKLERKRLEQEKREQRRLDDQSERKAEAQRKQVETQRKQAGQYSASWKQNNTAWKQNNMAWKQYMVAGNLTRNEIMRYALLAERTRQTYKRQHRHDNATTDATRATPGQRPAGYALRTAKMEDIGHRPWIACEKRAPWSSLPLPAKAAFGKRETAPRAPSRHTESRTTVWQQLTVSFPTDSESGII